MAETVDFPQFFKRWVLPAGVIRYYGFVKYVEFGIYHILQNNRLPVENSNINRLSLRSNVSKRYIAKMGLYCIVMVDSV